jgi:hypothetical protein
MIEKEATSESEACSRREPVARDPQRADRVPSVRLVRTTDLGQQMKNFGFLDAWNAGSRGREP